MKKLLFSFGVILLTLNIVAGNRINNNGFIQNNSKKDVLIAYSPSHPAVGEAKRRCKVYSSPNTKSRVIYVLSVNEEVDVIGQSGKFYEVGNPAYAIPGYTLKTNIRITAVY